MRKTFYYSVQNSNLFVEQLISWSATQSHFALLNSNGYKGDKSVKSSCNFIAGIQLEATFKASEKVFDALKNHRLFNKDWLFGYIAYDAKNDTEQITSNNKDTLNFPELCFFQPKIVLEYQENKLAVHYISIEKKDVIALLHEIETLAIQPANIPPISFLSRIEKKEYLDAIMKLKDEINYGNIYEINFCQEYYTQQKIDPPIVYNQLNDLSPAPFSSFMKLDNIHIMCASPERFLCKRGSKIYSQPIKGTIKRGENTEDDALLKQQLSNNPKERSENIMIVDLVRNDLSKIAVQGSVKVEEFCEIYTFPQVHQLISTISAQLNKKYDEIDAIKSCFPMGSMTGAPKVKAMQLIEQFEQSKRGIYAGTIGYFNPNGDFDFNVIIRSLLYNSSNNYLSLTVGGAITALSDPEMEYQECLTKAKAIFELFNFVPNAV